MRAIYFDGIRAKPIEVSLQIRGEYIEIYTTENELVNQYLWNRLDISISSFSANDNVILKNDKSSEQLQLIGHGVKEFMKFIVVKKPIDQRLLQFITTVSPLRLVMGSAMVIMIVIYGYMVYAAPFIGEKIVQIIPYEIENKAGNVIYQNMDLIIDKDSTKSALLMDFYNSCGFKSQYSIVFDYNKSSIVNAFALPGGRIVIFEGLIDRTKCWDELAALMAHELAHVDERHSLQQLSKSVVSYLAISILTGDMAGVSSVILDNAHNIYELSNSRKNEKEADMHGLNYLLDAKIRPESMVDLLKRLEHNEDNTTNEILSNFKYLNTHPSNGTRIKYIEDEIERNAYYNVEIIDNNKAEIIWQKLQNN